MEHTEVLEMNPQKAPNTPSFPRETLIISLFSVNSHPELTVWEI